MRPLLHIVPALVSLVLFGCGGVAQYDASDSYATGSASPASKADTDEPVAAADAELLDIAAVQNGAVPPANGAEIERKIVYTATLQMVVEDFATVPAKVVKLAQDHGGFIANSNIRGSSGSPRNGTWTIRVPVAGYGDFLEAASGLGEVTQRTTDSREVTAQFYDVEANIRNKQKEEDRLLKHLESSTDKLEDILAVEQNLSRVRGESERLQGRIRVLKDLTSFTTVTLEIREVKDYVPPEAPTFGTRIRRTWEGTLESLLYGSQNFLLFCIAAGPWIVIWAIPIVLFYKLLRYVVRRKRKPAKQ